MRTVWQESDRRDIARRVESVTVCAPRWGKMNAAEMLAHLEQALRMALGDVTPRRRNLPIRYFPLKQLLIYVLPFPKGAPTAPELVVRCDPAELATRRSSVLALLERAAARVDSHWPEHPAFGSLTRGGWGVLIYRHMDHHLRQFGA